MREHNFKQHTIPETIGTIAQAKTSVLARCSFVLWQLQCPTSGCCSLDLRLMLFQWLVFVHIGEEPTPLILIDIQEGQLQRV